MLFEHITHIPTSHCHSCPLPPAPSAEWPLVLGLELPLRAEQKPTIHSLLSLNDLDLRYNVLKMLLTSGMPLIKHSMYVIMSFSSSTYSCVFYISTFGYVMNYSAFRVRET